MSEFLQRLLNQLEAGRDSALLRLSLAQTLLATDPEQALDHAERALAFDPKYTAALKARARALDLSGQTDAAISAYEQAIAVAAERGDKQAEREMQVWLKRLLRG
jgi:Tfp pilus assembly protein PilF